MAQPVTLSDLSESWPSLDGAAALPQPRTPRVACSSSSRRASSRRPSSRRPSSAPSSVVGLPCPPRPPSPARQRSSSSSSALGSVVRGHHAATTPEWRKLALPDHPSTGRDLFEPSKLENLFAEPEPSFLPSSPQPWSRPTPKSHFSSASQPKTEPSVHTSSAENFSEAPIYKHYKPNGEVQWAVFDPDRSVIPGDSISQCEQQQQQQQHGRLVGARPPPPPPPPREESSEIVQQRYQRRPRAPTDVNKFQSIATRDYVDEAMKVLDALRRKERVSQSGLISPERVAHLIKPEEAGMFFDSQKRTWVRSSSDDPLAEIPDLSISAEASGAQHRPPPPPQQLARSPSTSPAGANLFIQNIRNNGKRVKSSSLLKGTPLQRVSFAESSCLDMAPSHTPPAVDRSNASSPTHELPLIPPSSEDTFVGGRGRRHPRLEESVEGSSLVREVSFVQQHPDGRTASVTLRMTPARASVRQVPQQTPASARARSFMHTLSPLTEFTMHQQDDAKHYRAQSLQEPGRPLSIRNAAAAPPSGAISSLVGAIFEACPNVAWEVMKQLDLSGCALESCHVLDEICPRLVQFHARENRLTQVQGIPSSVRDLDVSSNLLSSLTTWSALTNLQYLDISNNDLDSFDGLECLVHLRQLKASHNCVGSLTPLQDLDGLQVLDVSYNQLEEVDFTEFQWSNMEILDMSNNRLCQVRGLDNLEALDELEVSYNQLTTLDPGEVCVNTCPSLRILYAMANQFNELDVSPFQGLEVLTADGNKLVTIQGVRQHPRLHTLSLQDMKPNDFTTELMNLNDFYDMTHLCLAGTQLAQHLTLHEPFLNLRTLDICGTGIRTLPAHLTQLAPNLRNLDVSCNSLKDLSPLKGMLRLRRLMAASNRLERQRKIISALQGMTRLEEVGFADNPFTSGWYSTAEGKLDDATAMKKRIFELLLAAKLPSLSILDGYDFDRAGVKARDDVWNKLVGFGYVVSGKS